MNELIAEQLVRRLTPLVGQGIISDLAGLTTVLTTSVFSGNKEEQTIPAPVNPSDREQWRKLIPDTKKTAIVYFEDQGYRTGSVGPFTQVKSTLRLVCWYNTALLPVLNAPLPIRLLMSLCDSPKVRTVPVEDTIISKLVLNGYSTDLSDPFSKFTAYEKLFNFRVHPYNWFALNIAFTAYVSKPCLVA